MERQRKCLVPLIQRKLRQHAVVDMDGKGDHLKYIQQIFNHFCDRKDSVNLSCIGMEIEFMDQSLKDILLKQDGNGQYRVNADIFPNLTSYINENGEAVPIENTAK